MMWKFVEENNGKVVPNTNEGTAMVCDAFVWVVRQNPPGRMTVVAAVEESKSRFGRQPRERVLRATRFTKADAAAAAAFAAAQVAMIYERLAAEDDRLWRAIEAARGGRDDTLAATLDAVSLAASEARQAADGAAAFAAESARAAVLAAAAPDAGAALHSTGYAVAYAIQAADKIGAVREVTFAIEKWLLGRASVLKEVRG
jgi:hypothetical protein